LEIYVGVRVTSA